MRRSLLLCAMLAAAAGLGAQVPGSAARDPLVFEDIVGWIGDPRSSLDLFQEVVDRDFMAVRTDVAYSVRPSWFRMEDDSVFEASPLRFLFQGMFWGPLFASGLWTPPALLADLVFGGDGDIAGLPLRMLEYSLRTLKAQGEGEVPFSRLMRINVLFASDVVSLAFKRLGGLDGLAGPSLMGRGYAGLCFKLLDDYSLFLGYNLVHFPILYGYAAYLAAHPDFASGRGIAVVNEGDVLYETRSRLFVYTNLFDAVRLRGLLDLSSVGSMLDLLGARLSMEALLRRFGATALVARAGAFIPDLDVNWLGAGEGLSLELSRRLAIGGSLALYAAYAARVAPFIWLDRARIGASFTNRGFAAELEGSAFTAEGAVRLGAIASVSYRLEGVGRVRLRFSWNGDPATQALPPLVDSPVISLSLETGMDDGTNPLGEFLK